MATLQLSAGGSTSFTVSQLSTTLSQLVLGGTSSSVSGAVVICALGTLSLLLVDSSYNPSRQMLAQYSLSYDPTKPFNVACSSGNSSYTLQQALTACGYSGTINQLSDVYMALWDQGSNLALLSTADALVQSTGQALVAPARLKPLVGSGSVTVSSSGSSVVINGAATALSMPAVDNGYLLDNLSAQPKAAFSLYLLGSAYTGPCIKVRRSSDNAQQDFYVSGAGALGTSYQAQGTSYATWLGTATGNVVTWYDQSGNGNHATQPNTANQPTLSAAVTDVYFPNGVGFMLLGTAGSGPVPSGLNHPYTLMACHGQLTNASGGSLISGGTTATNQANMLRSAGSSGYASLWWGHDWDFGTQHGATRSGIVAPTGCSGLAAASSYSTADSGINVAASAQQFLGVNPYGNADFLGAHVYGVTIHASALSQQDLDLLIAFTQPGIPSGGQPLINRYNPNQLQRISVAPGGPLSVATVADEIVFTSTAQPLLSASNQLPQADVVGLPALQTAVSNLTSTKANGNVYLYTGANGLWLLQNDGAFPGAMWVGSSQVNVNVALNTLGNVTMSGGTLSLGGLTGITGLTHSSISDFTTAVNALIAAATLSASQITGLTATLTSLQPWFVARVSAAGAVAYYAGRAGATVTNPSTGNYTFVWASGATYPGVTNYICTVCPCLLDTTSSTTLLRGGYNQGTSTNTTLNVQIRNYWNSQYGTLQNCDFVVQIW